MIPADKLLINAQILAMDPNFNQYFPGAIAISGNHILAVGSETEICQSYSAPEIIDCRGKTLIPGLVNAHTHVPMTLLRGLADDLRLDVWLMGYMMPVEREFVSPDFVSLGTSLACAEMIRSGITSFADMYYFEDSVAQATAEAGMRAVCSQTVMKFATPDAASYEESLALARDFIQKWKGHPLIVPSVAPHAPYTCTPEILKATAGLAVEFDVPLHIHISETALEVENMRNDQGMPVVPYIKKQNLFDAKVLAAHCVHIDEGEMRTLGHYDAGVAHNPSSNLKLASGIAPVKRMLELGLHVGIGTDGPASNNDLDMFEEMRLAAFLAKGSSGDPTALPARTTLLMATRLGAEALHIGDITGSLEPGKRADLILVDMNPLHNSPQFRHDPESAYARIIYASKATDVSDVMINGKWVMRSHNLLTLNENELLIQSREYARKIDIFLMQREESVISKLIAVGGAAEEESFEVQVKVRIEDREVVRKALIDSKIQIVRSRHYRQYDTYFEFEDPSQGYLRYREDDFVNEKGDVTTVRSRLTLIGQAFERHFPQEVLLWRSRYFAPASQTLRFYREYFKPSGEHEIDKDRLRYKVNYKGTELYINIDQVKKPALGNFLEIKSRTWSRKDAEEKSNLVTELIQLLGISSPEPLAQDYVEMKGSAR
jgi:5-methylthioadenosine/S-adenosylhomocysteine deaminase